MINYAVLHFCPSPKKHVYMHDELLLCSRRPTMSEEGALSVRFREPKTFCEEEELVEKAVPSSTTVADPDLELRGGGVGGGLDLLALSAIFPSVLASFFPLK